jgi:lipopolysaccharide export system protein LptA
VWNPKRVLLLVVGFALFFTTYEIYAHFLGGIDGLPPLPEAYWPSDEPPIDLSKLPVRKNEADLKLSQAFGEDCQEVKERTIKLVVSTRGLVLAANQFTIEPDGRVKLTPFSIAIFGKDRPDFKYPDINTVRANEAYLTFDRPVSSPTEIGNRKIVGGELRGTITINNNRRTPEKNDDIQVTIGDKPLFYREADHRVWTDGTVELLDTQSRPNPTKINAVGMELYLTTTASPAKGGKKGKGETISGVDRILLKKNVKMHLYVDARSGFLGDGRPAGAANAEPRGAARPPAKTAPGSPGPRPPEPEKAHVMIDTDGPFHYDLRTEVATFDTPPRRPRGSAPLGRDQVLVYREHELGKGQGQQYDQLLCDHLKLQFRRKPGTDPRAGRDSQSVDREIESAHATGQEVVLSLDTEHLEARGTDLVYHCPTADRGPETTLKGNPLQATKDCNVIHASELWLLGSAQKGGPQRATARGPGRIDLADRNSIDPADPSHSTPRYPVHIFWKDMLVSAKDGPYDLMTLTGEACFVDDDHSQELHGQRLQVWLEPADRTPPGPGSPPAARQATPAAAEPGRPHPHRLEAFDHVTARSPDLNLMEAEHLVVWFRDAPVAQGELPATLPAAAPGAAGTARSNPPRKGEAPAEPGGKGSAGASPSQEQPAVIPLGPSGQPAGGPAENGAGKMTKKPIDLWARSVVVYVNRVGEKNELHKMLTEGSVHVHQDGEKPEDRGVDIRGETLELLHQVDPLHRPLGDLLVVLGDKHKPAQLQLGELFLVGPKVTIDQKENNAEVKGVGAMNMPSKTTFEGGKPSQPGTRLTVHWNEGMLFNGKDADFHGGVVAYQDNGRLRCRNLQVTLDRVVSFKEGQKAGKSANVEKMVCDRKVDIDETVRDKDRLQKYSRLVCQQMAMDNQEGPAIATGPGVVYLLQMGAVDNDFSTPVPASGSAPRNQAAAAPKEEMKLTRIEFEGRMFSDKKNNNRIAIFYDGVEAVNIPAERPDAPINKDRLPERGIYLTCEKMTVYTTPGPGGKASQTLIAERKVYVRTPEYQARAAKVTYEEAKDLIVFEGGEGALATFYKMKGPAGAPPQEFKGKKIFYHRLTKQFKVEDGGTIQYFD